MPETAISQNGSAFDSAHMDEEVRIALPKPASKSAKVRGLRERRLRGENYLRQKHTCQDQRDPTMSLTASGLIEGGVFADSIKSNRPGRTAKAGFLASVCTI